MTRRERRKLRQREAKRAERRAIRDGEPVEVKPEDSFKPRKAPEIPEERRDITIRMWRDDEISASSAGVLRTARLRQPYPFPNFDMVIMWGSDGGKENGPILVVALQPDGALAPERYVVNVNDIIRMIVENRDKMPPPETSRSRLILPGG